MKWLNGIKEKEGFWIMGLTGLGKEYESSNTGNFPEVRFTGDSKLGVSFSIDCILLGLDGDLLEEDNYDELQQKVLESLMDFYAIFGILPYIGLHVLIEDVILWGHVVRIVWDNGNKVIRVWVKEDEEY